MRTALRERLVTLLPKQHQALPWMIEYAAHFFDRFEVGHDAKMRTKE